MIENLETLIVLSKTGTMMETGTVLKISQSAVSKRIAALERYYDRPLIERYGRRVVLTHHGTHLVEKVSPLVSELRSVFLEDSALPSGKIILGVSEAILSRAGGRISSPRCSGTCRRSNSPSTPSVRRRCSIGCAAASTMVGICTRRLRRGQRTCRARS